MSLCTVLTVCVAIVAATSVFGSPEKSVKPETLKIQIEKCANETGFYLPDDRPHYEPDVLRDLLNVSCDAFPTFFGCAAGYLQDYFVSTNPKYPASFKEVVSIYHAVCDEPNNEAAVCFLRNDAHSRAYAECFQIIPVIFGARLDRCTESKVFKACVVEKMAQSSCGEKAADILNQVVTIYDQTIFASTCY